MLSSMFESSTLPLLQQVVSFTAARHGVLAGNIANLDTPGYRSRDLSTEDFQASLKQAIEDRSRPTYSARAPYPHSPGSPAAAPAAQARDPWAKVADSVKGMLRHDDNNTSLEEQVSEIAKNYAAHNLALSLMSQQFRLLRAAITERA